MTEEIENTEETIEEPEDKGFSELDEDTQELMTRMGTTMDEAEADAEEEAAEEEVADDTVPDEGTDVPDKGTHIFELDDGTKVTAEEAKAGYLRHGDYTQKSQANADERKNIEKYNEIFTKMENDPKLAKMVIDYMVGEQPAQVPAAEAVQQIPIPAGYESDPAVKLLVDEANRSRAENSKTRAELAELKGGINTRQQAATQEKQQVSQKATLDARLGEGYEYLKGQVGTLPPPEEYVATLQKYMFEEQKLDPKVVGNYIIGGDPDYLRAKIDGAFKADIDAARADKTNSGEKERKKRKTKATTLRAGGRSSNAAAKSLPKGPDGKTDLKAALMQIQDAEAELTRR